MHAVLAMRQRQADREITIPWGFRLPEPGESGVRLRAPERELRDSRAAPRFDDQTAVMAGARLRLPPSAMYSEPPPMPTMPPPPMMPQNMWPMPTTLAPTQPAPAMPAPAAPAPAPRRRAPVTPAAPLGWRIYVVITTALMAALGTSVFFLTGHASLITHPADASAPPVINVTVPAPPAPPAPAAPPPVAPAPASAAPPAPSPARVARNAPRPTPAPAKPPPPLVAAAAPTPTVTAVAPPPAPPPAPTSTVSPQAQETAEMLREQLGAAVH